MAYYRSRPTRVGFLFCEKTSKARSKLRGIGRGRPCLLQKMVKGTVEIGSCGAQVTVPFAKKRQRHGRNREAEGAGDRAFCKKRSKARSKSAVVGCSRPCLLQKNVKGTVKIVRQRAQPTVPFSKKRQRHGQNWRLWGVADRAFCKKTSKARSKSEINGHWRPRIGAFGAGRSWPDGRQMVNKKADPHGSAPYISPSSPRTGRLLTFRLKTPLFIAVVVPASHPLAYRASR